MAQVKILGPVVAATIALLLTDSVAKSQIQNVCSGELAKDEDGGLYINIPPEAVCLVDAQDVQKVLSICAEGQNCEVKGEVSDCGEDEGECAKIEHITSVKALK